MLADIDEALLVLLHVLDGLCCVQSSADRQLQEAKTDPEYSCHRPYLYSF